MDYSSGETQNMASSAQRWPSGPDLREASTMVSCGASPGVTRSEAAVGGSQLPTRKMMGRSGSFRLLRTSNAAVTHCSNGMPATMAQGRLTHSGSTSNVRMGTKAIKMSRERNAAPSSNNSPGALTRIHSMHSRCMDSNIKERNQTQAQTKKQNDVENLNQLMMFHELRLSDTEKKLHLFASELSTILAQLDTATSDISTTSRSSTSNSEQYPSSYQEDAVGHLNQNSNGWSGNLSHALKPLDNACNLTNQGFISLSNEAKYDYNERLEKVAHSLLRCRKEFEWTIKNLKHNNADIPHDQYNDIAQLQANLEMLESNYRGLKHLISSDEPSTQPLKDLHKSPSNPTGFRSADLSRKPSTSTSPHCVTRVTSPQNSKRFDHIAAPNSICESPLSPTRQLKLPTNNLYSLSLESEGTGLSMTELLAAREFNNIRTAYALAPPKSWKNNKHFETSKS